MDLPDGLLCESGETDDRDQGQLVTFRLETGTQPMLNYGTVRRSQAHPSIRHSDGDGRGPRIDTMGDVDALGRTTPVEPIQPVQLKGLTAGRRWGRRRRRQWTSRRRGCRRSCRFGWPDAIRPPSRARGAGPAPFPYDRLTASPAYCMWPQPRSDIPNHDLYIEGHCDGIFRPAQRMQNRVRSRCSGRGSMVTRAVTGRQPIPSQDDKSIYESIRFNLSSQLIAMTEF